MVNYDVPAEALPACQMELNLMAGILAVSHDGSLTVEVTAPRFDASEANTAIWATIAAIVGRHGGVPVENAR